MSVGAGHRAGSALTFLVVPQLSGGGVEGAVIVRLWRGRQTFIIVLHQQDSGANQKQEVALKGTAHFHF